MVGHFGGGYAGIDRFRSNQGVCGGGIIWSSQEFPDRQLDLLFIPIRGIEGVIVRQQGTHGPTSRHTCKILRELPQDRFGIRDLEIWWRYDQLSRGLQ